MTRRKKEIFLHSPKLTLEVPNQQTSRPDQTRSNQGNIDKAKAVITLISRKLIDNDVIYSPQERKNDCVKDEHEDGEDEVVEVGGDEQELMDGEKSQEKNEKKETRVE